MDVCSLNGGAPLAGEVPHDLHMAFHRSKFWGRLCLGLSLPAIAAASTSSRFAVFLRFSAMASALQKATT